MDTITTIIPTGTSNLQPIIYYLLPTTVLPDQAPLIYEQPERAFSSRSPSIKQPEIDRIDQFFQQIRQVTLGSHQVNVKMGDLFSFLRAKLGAHLIACQGGQIARLLPEFSQALLRETNLGELNQHSVPERSLTFLIRFHSSNQDDLENIYAIKRVIADYFYPNQQDLFESSDPKSPQFDLNLCDQINKLTIELKFSIDQPQEKVNDAPSAHFQQTPYTPPPFSCDDLFLNLNPIVDGIHRLRPLELSFESFTNQTRSFVDEIKGIINLNPKAALKPSHWIAFYYMILKGMICFHPEMERKLWDVMMAQSQGKDERKAALHWLKTLIETKHLQKDEGAIIALCSNLYSFLSLRGKAKLAEDLWKDIQKEYMITPKSAMKDHLQEFTDPMVSTVIQLVNNNQVAGAYAFLHSMAFLNCGRSVRSLFRSNFFDRELIKSIRFELNQGESFCLFPLDVSESLGALLQLKLNEDDSFQLFPDCKREINKALVTVLANQNWEKIDASAKELVEKGSPLIQHLGIELLVSSELVKQINSGNEMRTSDVFKFLESRLEYISTHGMGKNLYFLPLDNNQVNKLTDWLKKASQVSEGLIDKIDPEKALSAFFNLRQGVKINERQKILRSIHDRLKKRGMTCLRKNLFKLTSAYEQLLDEGKSPDLFIQLRSIYKQLLDIGAWKHAITLIPKGYLDPRSGSFTNNWLLPLVRHPNGGFRGLKWIFHHHPKIYEQIVDRAFEEKFDLIGLFCRYYQFEFATKLLERNIKKALVKDNISEISADEAIKLFGLLKGLLFDQSMMNLEQVAKQQIANNFCALLAKQTAKQLFHLIRQDGNSLPEDHWQFIVTALSNSVPLEALEILCQSNDSTLNEEQKAHCWTSCLQGMARIKLDQFIHQAQDFLKKFPEDYQLSAVELLFNSTTDVAEKQIIIQQLDAFILKLDQTNDQKLKKFRQAIQFELLKLKAESKDLNNFREALKIMKKIIEEEDAMQPKHYWALTEFCKTASNEELFDLVQSLIKKPGWHKGILPHLFAIEEHMDSDTGIELLECMRSLLEINDTGLDLITKQRLIKSLNQFIRSNQPITDQILTVFFECLNHDNFTNVFSRQDGHSIFKCLLSRLNREYCTIQQLPFLINFYQAYFFGYTNWMSIEEKRAKFKEILKQIPMIKTNRTEQLKKTLHVIGLSESLHLMDLSNKDGNPSALIEPVNNAHLNYLSTLLSNKSDAYEKDKDLKEIGKGLRSIIESGQYNELELLKLLERFAAYAFLLPEGSKSRRIHLRRLKKVITKAETLMESSDGLKMCKVYTESISNESTTLSVNNCKKILSQIGQHLHDDLGFQLLETLILLAPDRKEIVLLMNQIAQQIFDKADTATKTKFIHLPLRCLIKAKDHIDDQEDYYVQVGLFIKDCSKYANYNPDFLIEMAGLFAPKKILQPTNKRKIQNQRRRRGQPIQKTEPQKPKNVQETASWFNQWHNWLKFLCDLNKPEAFLIALANVLQVKKSQRWTEFNEKIDPLLNDAWDRLNKTELQKILQCADEKTAASLCQRLKFPQTQSLRLPFILEHLLILLQEKKFFDESVAEIRNLFYQNIVDNNVALEVMTLSGYPTEKLQSKSPSLRLLGKRMLSRMQRIVTDTKCKFQEISRCFAIVKRFYKDPRNDQERLAYFTFLSSMVGRMLEQDFFLPKDLDLLTNWLKKMNECKLVLKPELTSKLLEKAKHLPLSELFPFVRSLKSCGIPSLVFRLKLLEIIPKLKLEDPADLSIRIVDAFTGNEVEQYLKENTKSAELRGTIEYIFKKFFNFQYEDLFLHSSMCEAVKNIAPIIRLPVFRLLIDQDRMKEPPIPWKIDCNPQEPLFTEVLRRYCLLLHPVSPESCNEEIEGLKLSFKGLKIPDNVFQKADYLDNLRKFFEKLSSDLKAGPAFESISTITKSYDDALCFPPDREIIENVTNILRATLDEKLKWIDNPAKQELASHLTKALRLLNQWQVKLDFLLPYFKQFLTIFTNIDQWTVFFYTFLFAGMVRIDQKEFNACRDTIFDGLQQLSKLNVKSEEDEAKKNALLFRLELFWTELCFKYGTYDDCVKALKRLQSINFNKINVHQNMKVFSALQHVFAFSLNRPKGEESLHPEMAETYKIIRNSTAFDNFQANNLKLRLAYMGYRLNRNKKAKQALYECTKKCIEGDECNSLVMTTLWELSTESDYEDILNLWNAFVTKFLENGLYAHKLRLYLTMLFLSKTHQNPKLTIELIHLLSDFFVKHSLSQKLKNALLNHLQDCIEENLRLSQSSSDHVSDYIDLENIHALTDEQLKNLALQKIDRKKFPSKEFTPAVLNEIMRAFRQNEPTSKYVEIVNGKIELIRRGVKKS